MSGLSSVGSSLATSPSSPTSLLSSVGQSLLTAGQAPLPTAGSATTPGGAKISPYQAEFQTLQQQDTAELLYASFLSPDAALANADAVLGQAAQLLGTPGSHAPSQSGSSSSGSSASSSNTASSSVPTIPSVASILSASDAAAQQTLSSYASAPAGSSIVDFQA